MIFWHHRLIHSNGMNTGDDMRMAVLCDYMRDDRLVRLCAAFRQILAHFWLTLGSILVQMVEEVSREAMSLRMAREQEDAGKGSHGRHCH